MEANLDRGKNRSEFVSIRQKAQMSVSFPICCHVSQHFTIDVRFEGLFNFSLPVDTTEEQAALPIHPRLSYVEEILPGNTALYSNQDHFNNFQPSNNL